MVVLLSDLVQPLTRFLEAHRVHPDEYNISIERLHRFIRVRAKHHSCSESHLCLVFQGALVAWLPGFIAIPPHISLHGVDEFEQGIVSGMDAASGFGTLTLSAVRLFTYSRQCILLCDLITTAFFVC